MKLHRKQFTTLALAALATGFLGSATAQSAYPGKTVTMVVPTAAGGTTDLSARMLAQALAPVLGQSVIADNKGGGNGNIAASVQNVLNRIGIIFRARESQMIIRGHFSSGKLQRAEGIFRVVVKLNRGEFFENSKPLPCNIGKHVQTHCEFLA